MKLATDVIKTLLDPARIKTASLLMFGTPSFLCATSCFSSQKICECFGDEEVIMMLFNEQTND